MTDTTTAEAEAETRESEQTAEAEPEDKKADTKAQDGAGAAEAASQVEDTGAEEEPSAADWRALVKDAEAKKVAERFNSPEEMAKAVGDLRKQISDRIKLPGKDADEKEVAKFRKALGVPEQPDGYEVKLPEGVELNEAEEQLVEALKPMAHERNIPAEAFNGFVEKFKEFESQIVQQHEAAIEKQREEAETALKEEWGKDYKANVNLANRALSQFLGEEEAEFVKQAELKDGGVLANHPAMVKLFAKLGRQMSEDGTINAVDESEARDLDQRLQELTTQIHMAHRKGDKVTVDKLSKERSEISERLYGSEPVVGSGGRAA